MKEERREEEVDAGRNIFSPARRGKPKFRGRNFLPSHLHSISATNHYEHLSILFIAEGPRI
jgi:hypothetical protein